jgi:hypothetical protein
MADLSLSVAVTRAQLGLGNLNINDHISYYCAAQFLGGSMTWNRQQISSPYMDGSVTVNRTRGVVMEPVAVEVLGSTDTALQTNMATLLAALSQDTFDLLVGIGSAQYQYLCEAADVQNAGWSGPRMIAKQAQIVFQVPRQPVPILGGV